MVVVSNIDYQQFPRQGLYLGWRVKVCFKYDLENRVMGTIVRDDIEEPFRTIIRLDDGRFVLSTECQYSLVAFHFPMLDTTEPNP